MHLSEDPSQVPVFILCGGLGTRLKEETEFRPKPMVPIGERPILWHIMQSYSLHGFKRFVLCTGFKSEVIKSYFLNYSSMNSDFTVNLGKNELTIHSYHHDQDWEVTVAYTGEETMTGARAFLAAQRYLDTDIAAVTYGDGLTNANLRQELAFHLEHGKMGTVLGVNPPSRFGEIQLNGNEVAAFSEKPEFKESWINGGYFFFNREFFRDYLSSDPSCILERAPLVQLANDKQLHIFKHDGFWSCMDTQRDHTKLTQMVQSGQTPWLETGVLTR